MSYILLAALASAGIGAAPLALRKKYVWAAIVAIVSFFVLWGVYYLAIPSTVYPLYGPVGFATAIVLAVSAAIDGISDEEFPWTAVFPCAYVLAMIGIGIYGWSAFNASTYAGMIGKIEHSDWTKDIQPKDPRHMLMVSTENAGYIAKKMVGQGGTIGSQFSLDTKHMTLQRVGNELVYVAPFDFKDFSTWTAVTGVPGFIKIYGEDPERQPHYVQLPASKPMNYTPKAYFGYNLKRHLRNSGFLDDGLFEFRFELDDDGNPFWVVTTYKLKVSFFAEEVTGVATVNPTSGEIKRYKVAEAPAWIDRIYPSPLIQNYLKWNGLYTGGWLNSWWSNLDLTEPEDTKLIYSSGQKSEWVTGISSPNLNDDSLIGLTYVDTRTGHAKFYSVKGGGTDSAVIKAVNSNEQVKYKHLHASIPQTYNVYGTMAAVVALLNNEGAFQGVAIVPLLNVQDVAVGRTQLEALRSYQALVSRRGQQIAIEKTHDSKELTGVIDRIRMDVGTNGGIYFFHVDGVPRIFTASSQDYVKLPLTQAGDTVLVRYIASSESIVPVQMFDNLSLPLDKTDAQNEVEQAAGKRKQHEEALSSTGELRERLRTMSREELLRLNEFLKN